MAVEGLAPATSLLLAGLILDALIGDPQFRFHPIRLIGGTLSRSEAFLRRRQWDGYGGGCALFFFLTVVWVVLPSLLVMWAGRLLHILVVYIFFSLRNLLDHVRTVKRAAQRDDLVAARKAIGLLVGRDTDRM